MSVAAIGVATGGIALVWRIYEWKRSAPLINVKGGRSHFYRRLGNGDLEPILTDGQVTIVNVVNRGRLPARIATYGFRVTAFDGTRYDMNVHETDPEKLPVVVAPHDSYQFRFLDSLILDDWAARRIDLGRAFAVLTTGERIEDPHEIRFFDSPAGTGAD